MGKRGYLSPRQHAAIRLTELIKSHRWRTRYKVEIKPDAWLFVICHALAPLKEREGGLDLLHLKEFANRHGMSFPDDDAMVLAIHNVCDYRARHPKFRSLCAKTAGKMLEITADERWRCGITTMDPIDETRAERKSLQRQSDRERKQRERRAKGVVPRQEYEAASLSRTKPWLALGVGRRTWERRRKAGVLQNIVVLDMARADRAKADSKHDNLLRQRLVA
jgi:hypothetical protein